MHLAHVFSTNGTGGNLVPLVLDAAGMADSEMQTVARKYGRESSYSTKTLKAEDCHLLDLDLTAALCFEEMSPRRNISEYLRSCSVQGDRARHLQRIRRAGVWS